LLRSYASPSSHIGRQVAAEDRVEEDERLRNLGLTVPEEGLVVSTPYDRPFSTRSFVVPQAWFPKSGLRVFAGSGLTVRADKLLPDIDILQEVMSRAYGGWDSAQERGWAWDRWFLLWKLQLSHMGETELPLRQAFAPVEELLRFQRDNHTQIPLENFLTASPSQTAMLEFVPDGPCVEVHLKDGSSFDLDPADPAQRVRTALVPNDEGDDLKAAYYLAVPTSRGNLATIRCGETWIPLHTISSGPRSPTGFFLHEVTSEMWGSSKPEVRLLDPEVAYIRLPTLNPSNYAKVAKDRQHWPRPTGEEKLLIVDLRDNGGGAYGLGLDVLHDWVPMKWLPPAEGVSMNINASCLYPALKWGFDDVFLRGLKPPLDDETKRWLQADLDRVLKPTNDDCRRQMRRTDGKWSYRDHHVKQKIKGMRIVVLVNEGCASDCELLTWMLSAVPNAMVVGTNTSGVGQFVQPGYGVLPNTGLPFRIALGESDIYGDRRSFDGYGLDVDVVLPTSKEWKLDRLARWAAKYGRE
jgi:hypothetical protein